MINLQKNEQELTEHLMGKINLSKDKEKLEKHVVNLSKCIVDLSKKSNVDLGATKARVAVVLDYSGSMSSTYRNGMVQEVINKLVPLGLTFDDNGSIDTYLFQDTYKKIDDITIDNYGEYVTKVVNNCGYEYGGTKYAPVLKAILNKAKDKKGVLDKLFKKNTLQESDPIFVLFITDGDNFDKDKSEEVIRESSKYKMFVQFIGIGKAKFEFLYKLDDLEGREVDNTGFNKFVDISKVSDGDLYNAVLEQFADWLDVIKDWG